MPILSSGGVAFLHMPSSISGVNRARYWRAPEGRGGGSSVAIEPGETKVGELVQLMEHTLDIVERDANSCPFAQN